MNFYQSKRLLWGNILISLFIFAFLFGTYSMVGSLMMADLTFPFLLFFGLVGMIFVGVALWLLISSLGWLLTQHPLLVINQYEVKIYKNPWQQTSFNAKDIVSFRYEVRQNFTSDTVNTKTYLTIKSKNQAAVTLSLSQFSGGIDDIREAVNTYLPQAEWRE